MTSVHPTAVVHKDAKLDEGVRVGPYCVVGAGVKIGKGSRLHPGVILDGDLAIGRNNEFFPFCTVGHAPQDLSYGEEPTKVVIGDDNVFREHVSVHRGTVKDQGVTIVGDGNLLMAYVHLAHDVVIGSHCVVSNITNLAGHVHIADRVVLGANVLIAQHVSVGRSAYVQATTRLNRDIPHFCITHGNPGTLRGINIIGMRRQNYDRQVIMDLVDFYRAMESSALSPKSFVENQELVRKFQGNSVIMDMVAFIKKSKTGVALLRGP